MRSAPPPVSGTTVSRVFGGARPYPVFRASMPFRPSSRSPPRALPQSSSFCCASVWRTTCPALLRRAHEAGFRLPSNANRVANGFPGNLVTHPHEISELIAPTGQARTHGADGNAEKRCRILVGHSLHTDEQDDLALLLCQLP